MKKKINEEDKLISQIEFPLKRKQFLTDEFILIY